MSCWNNQKKRQTYPHIKELAKKCLSMVQDDIVIYKMQHEDNVFNFCCLSDYNENKGEQVTILQNPLKNKI